MRSPQEAPRSLVGLSVSEYGEADREMQKDKELSTEHEGAHERRRNVRHPIAGAASFQWRTLDGKRCEASGVTSNIGKNGAFVECELQPPLGSLIRLTITLPTYSRTHGLVCLCGIGHVRHTKLEACEATGFGACVEFRLEVANVLRTSTCSGMRRPLFAVTLASRPANALASPSRAIHDVSKAPTV